MIVRSVVNGHQVQKNKNKTKTKTKNKKHTKPSKIDVNIKGTLRISKADQAKHDIVFIGFMVCVTSTFTKPIMLYTF